jgi:hypothetical protein
MSYEAIAAYCAAPTKQDPWDKTRDRRRGRDEHRLLTMTTAMTDHLAAWSRPALVGRLTRMASVLPLKHPILIRA